MNQSLPEFWLGEPLPDIITLLQPVAHALLQAQREIHELFEHSDEHLLWETPGGNASPAFHLQHIAGVLDRLFTYSRGEAISQEQLAYLSKEGKKSDALTVDFLLKNLDQQIESSIRFLKTINDETLTEVRYVGRNKIASTQIGLLFHAAEHTMRHTGQLLVTVKMIDSGSKINYQ